MKNAKPVYWTLVCCSLFLLLQCYYKYRFFYAEQLQLFLYTGTYASDLIARLGGVSLYLARFLVQFYHLPAFGALCNACLLTAICLLTHKILEKTVSAGYVYLLSTIPACTLLWLHPDIHYNIQGTIAYLCMLAAILLYMRITPPTQRLVTGLILTILLFWMAGPVALLFAGMALLLDVIHKKTKAGLSAIYLPVLFMAGLAAIRLGWQGAYRMVFLPDAYYEPLLHSKTIYLSWIALPLCLLISTFLRNRRRTRETATGFKKQFLLLSVWFIPFLCFLCWMPQRQVDVFQRNMQQDYYLRTQQWDKIIAGFPGEEKSNLQTYNILNLALARKGVLGNQLFNYNKQGYKTLLADWDSSLPAAIALSDIYYHIGDIGTAQKLAFEGMVASPNDGNVRSLMRLIETNILFGEYSVAEKYVTWLEKTLFYKKEASVYRQFLYDDAAVEQDPVLGAKRKALVKNGVYAVSNNVMHTLERLANNNPANQMAIQYLLAICLANKDLKYFKTLLEKYFRTDVLPVLSAVHQEAVIALEQNNPAFWIQNGVDTKTEQRFRAFDYDMKNRNVPDFAEKMRSSYGNTYWYYVLFMNTKTNKTDENVNLYNADYQPRILRGGGEIPDNQSIAQIFPDYADVTIPVNIAPLNFSVTSGREAMASLTCKDYAFNISANKKGEFIIPSSKWKTLLQQAKGDRLEVSVSVLMDGIRREAKSFCMYVADEPVDPYIVYRLIEPGYALWNKMGIYQRNLEDYRESAVYENKMTNYNCVNCHSFCAFNPEKMLFHHRAKYAGTVMTDGDEVHFLQTKTEQTISALVYPSWHPSGKYVAFSVNRTTQNIHPAQRVEVFDLASDVVVYDVEEQTILATPATFSNSDFETFPTFSADGKTLYFCSGTACTLPDSIQDLKYHLCSVSFDAERKTFGHQTDTLYHAIAQGQSVSFPRVSPDGKYLMCTLSSYGTFPIWHKDADLYLIDLETKKGRYPENVNSEQVDSYHSWSSNSRWVVFSSRRLDGLYTRPFLVYVNENGETARPFLLPQKRSATYYTELAKSYNIPEFVTGKVKDRAYAIMKKAKDETTHEQVSFKMK